LKGEKMKRSNIFFLAFVFNCAFLLSISEAKTTIFEIPLNAQEITVYVSQAENTINPEIYGHFSEHLGRCIYDGIWVGEKSDIPNIRGIRKDVAEALKQMKIPVLRWPGGCFADEYHWKNGIGPKEKRAKTVNTTWGMVVEDNSFGTHEFLDLCELLGCEAYIAGNVGSGTPEEMMEWVEYMTFDGNSEMANLRKQNGRLEPWKIKYFGVGNENWGCGGNMTAEYYADLYKKFSTYVKNYPGSQIKKVACGPGDWNTHWMDVVLKNAGQRLDAISLHYYVFTGNWGNKGSAIDFGDKDWFKLMKNSLDVNRLLNEHIKVMDKYDRNRRIELCVDEWGTWWNVESGRPEFLYQQNTLRDAVSAGIFLNAFNNHCDRVKMANIAQTVNVLQSMILTEGNKMVLTPTYHVFEMYKVHQGAKMIPVDSNCTAYTDSDEKLPSIDVSASITKTGTINLTVCNLNPASPAEIVCELKDYTPKTIKGRTLTAEKMNTHNTFDKPNAVKPENLSGLKIKGQKVFITLPAKSVNVIEIES
jgi:alpha-L-arabinofuranosidase